MTDFFAQYASIEPWLKTKSPTPEKEWRQSPEERHQLDGLYECIWRRRTTGCPSYWWNGTRFRAGHSPARASLDLDSRDEATGERLDEIEDFVSALSLSHYLQLCAGLPEEPEPG